MRYSIIVDSDREEISKVLGILFSYDYVFNSELRLRTVKDFFKFYEAERGENFDGWNYICVGTDEECKMVVEAYSDGCSDSDPMRN